MIAMLMAATCLAGCQTTPFFTLKQSYRSVADQNDETVGSIFIWSNDVNAAVIYKTGVVCAQRAMTVMTADSRIDAQVSDSILKLSEAMASTAAATVATAAAAADDPAGPTPVQASAQASQNDALITLAGSITEAAQLLTTTTERTAFLDVGMFYLCQLANNGSITTDHARSLTALLIQEAGGLETAAGGAVQRAIAVEPADGPRPPLAPLPPRPATGPARLPGG
jgi:hypothetical protein